MKKILKCITGCMCFTSIILAGCENPDGSCDVIWTLEWLFSAVICALAYKELEEAK